jgi:hypothetical protein
MGMRDTEPKAEINVQRSQPVKFDDERRGSCVVESGRLAVTAFWTFSLVLSSSSRERPANLAARATVQSTLRGQATRRVGLDDPNLGGQTLLGGG